MIRSPIPSSPDGNGRPYAACLSLPFALIGVCIRDEAITGLDFLPPGTPPRPAQDGLTLYVEAELQAYLRDPHHRFDLPVRTNGTPFRQRVWAALDAIPVGETRTYGELARQMDSSARAVGQALGDNPLPIIVPCHRVVSSGGLGGFAHEGAGFTLDIKRWLLRHEGVRSEG